MLRKRRKRLNVKSPSIDTLTRESGRVVSGVPGGRPNKKTPPLRSPLPPPPSPLRPPPVGPGCAETGRPKSGGRCVCGASGFRWAPGGGPKAPKRGRCPQTVDLRPRSACVHIRGNTYSQASHVAVAAPWVRQRETKKERNIRHQRHLAETFCSTPWQPGDWFNFLADISVNFGKLKENCCVCRSVTLVRVTRVADDVK